MIILLLKTINLLNKTEWHLFDTKNVGNVD